MPHRLLAQPGALELSFNPALNSGAAVYVVKLQTNGQILIGGAFTSIDNTNLSNVARLNPDGSLDTTFNPGPAADVGYVNTIAVQNDGKVLIGGSFSSSSGATSANLTRLNPDGSVDESFDPLFFVDAPVNAVVLQSDGKALIGGGFAIVDNVLRRSVARLNTNGTVDLTFDACVASSAGSGATALALQGDGRTLVSGSFTFTSGLSRDGIARLGHNGDLDTTFAAEPGVNSGATVYALGLRTNGTACLCGDFESFDFRQRHGIVQLDGLGAVDLNFNPATGLDIGTTLYALAIQGDDKAIIAGDFTQYNGQSKSGIARFNPDGGLDTTCDSGSGPNNSVSSFAIQTDGRILAAGKFSAFNGFARNGLARLKGDPVRPRLGAPSRLENGRFQFILYGETDGHYAIESSSNLVDWISITNFTATGSATPVVDPDASKNRFYRGVSDP
jgi:uncharacterized delta-60 repeat protein